MASTKTELLERTRALWETARHELATVVSAHGPHEVPTRLDVYERVTKLVPSDDDLAELASWAFNQSIDRLARTPGAPKGMRNLITSVTLELFDEEMTSNLVHACWADEELAWRNTPARLHDIQ